MIGSIDCSKWFWKNCPTALHGQYEGKEGKPALTIEVIADDQLWIWHSFFGTPGCANDINVLEASTLSNKIADCTYPPPIEYQIFGETRNIPYWLADGVYPRWPCLVQTVSHPVTRKEKVMAECQEAARKDAERAFGVLKGKWHILDTPSKFWYTRTMKYVMECCVILHNMMIEHRIENEETVDASVYLEARVGDGVLKTWTSAVEGGQTTPPPGSIGAICAVARFMRNEGEFFKTRELVMNHLWERRGHE